MKDRNRKTEEETVVNVRLALNGTRVRLVTPGGRLGMIIARDPLTPGQERCLREIRPYFQEYPEAARKMGVARVFASANYMYEFDAITKCSIMPFGHDVMFAAEGGQS